MESLTRASYELRSRELAYLFRIQSSTNSLEKSMRTMMCVYEIDLILYLTNSLQGYITFEEWRSVDKYFIDLGYSLVVDKLSDYVFWIYTLKSQPRDVEPWDRFTFNTPTYFNPPTDLVAETSYSSSPQVHNRVLRQYYHTIRRLLR